MSLRHTDAKMPSLKDKIKVQAEEVQTKLEKHDEKQTQIIKKASKKK